MLNLDFWQFYHCAEDERPATPPAEPLDFAKVFSRFDAGGADDEEDLRVAELVAFTFTAITTPCKRLRRRFPSQRLPWAAPTPPLTPPRHRTTPLTPWKLTRRALTGTRPRYRRCPRRSPTMVMPISSPIRRVRQVLRITARQSGGRRRFPTHRPPPENSPQGDGVHANADLSEGGNAG